MQSFIAFWSFARLITVLRVTLGFIFIMAGKKIAFPADVAALTNSYTDPSSGWISPIFVEKITSLGIDIGTFLQVQGLIEMTLGVLLIFGVATPIIAVIMGLMYWSFTAASPIAGDLRLSRDLALMGLSFALAIAGSGAWSIDANLRQKAASNVSKENVFLLIVRLSLAYTLLASALFAGGKLNNVLNTTLPLPIVFLMGVLLALGLFPRWVNLVIVGWMLFLAGNSIAAKGLWWGLEGAKRELGFLSAAWAYLMLGSDCWAFDLTRFKKMFNKQALRSNT